MRSETLGGSTIYAKHGVIEHLGDSLVTAGGTTHSTFRFDDGEMLRNVSVDPLLRRFVGAGLGGRYIFVKLGRGYALVGVEVEGIGLRTADPSYWARTAHAYFVQGVGSLLLGLAFSVLLIGIVFLIACPFVLYAGYVFSRAASVAKRLKVLGAIARERPALELALPMARAA